MSVSVRPRLAGSGFGWLSQTNQAASPARTQQNLCPQPSKSNQAAAAAAAAAATAAAAEPSSAQPSSNRTARHGRRSHGQHHHSRRCPSPTNNPLLHQKQTPPSSTSIRSLVFRSRFFFFSVFFSYLPKDQEGPLFRLESFLPRPDAAVYQLPRLRRRTAQPRPFRHISPATPPVAVFTGLLFFEKERQTRFLLFRFVSFS